MRIEPPAKKRTVINPKRFVYAAAACAACVLLATALTIPFSVHDKEISEFEIMRVQSQSGLSAAGHPETYAEADADYKYREFTPVLPHEEYYTDEQKLNLFGRTQPQTQVQVTASASLPDNPAESEPVEICRDGRYVYIMAAGFTENIILTFADGTELSVISAVARGRISGEDLVLNNVTAVFIANPE
jgi:hypothetical protein